MTGRAVSRGKTFQGFTLVELLVVVVVLAIFLGIVAFSAGGARTSARDKRRKADLAEISSGLTRYRSDCGQYPAEADFESVPAGGNLTGDGSTPACLPGNIYIREMPQDPQPTDRDYSYNLISASDFILCTALEEDPSPTVDTSQCSVSSCGETCNYSISGP